MVFYYWPARSVTTFYCYTIGQIVLGDLCDDWSQALSRTSAEKESLLQFVVGGCMLFLLALFVCRNSANISTSQ